MVELRTVTPNAHPARMKLEPYSAEIRLGALTVGVDNIHYDIFLSSRFYEFSKKYLGDLVRQAVNINLFYGKDRKQSGTPEHAAFRKLLTEILQESLTRAKFAKSIEFDLLNQLAMLKHLSQETSNQFASLIVECKDWIRARGQHYEHSEQAHVMRAKIADIQADRKATFRHVGETVCKIWREVEEQTLAKSRRALFGDEYRDTYDLLQNRLLFVENGNDEYLFLEHYVLLGNFVNDPDRFEVFDTLLIDFVREFVVMGNDNDDLGKARKLHERLMEQGRTLRTNLARLEEEIDEAIGGKSTDVENLFPTFFKRKSGAGPVNPTELGDLRRRYSAIEKSLEDLSPQIESAKRRMDFLNEETQGRLGDYLNQPANARHLFDHEAPTSEGEASPQVRTELLEEFIHRLEERELFLHVLAGYELRKIHGDYCPPVHLQALKKALVNKEDAKRVEQLLEKMPAKKTSTKKMLDAARNMRRRTREELRATGLRFVEDFMRLRRDRRNYQQVAAWLERINLVRSEQARSLSRANKSLYELLMPEESRPVEDVVINHTVIKADVRGSTGITKDLYAKGLNPASHFSMNLHEPVKRMLERYGAATVFIEGDAIILAIDETEATRTTMRGVARACVLAREILAVTQAYNGRAKTTIFRRSKSASVLRSRIPHHLSGWTVNRKL